MSEHSSPSANTDFSEFSIPPARSYRPHNMSNPHPMSLIEKHTTLLALSQHRINTLPALRRVEEALALLDTPDVAEPMTAAWTYYVTSNSLLTELRALTRRYAFSSQCVDEARRRVYEDPRSNPSWNLAWLVLRKIGDEHYAQYQAAVPASWSGQTPNEEQVAQLTEILVREWEGAVGQMLRYWEVPPTQ